MSCKEAVPFEEVLCEEAVPFEEVLCEEKVPFEEEVPCVQSFGKLRGWCVKNQNKLDKHYINKEEVLPKYSQPVIRKIPPFSKKYKSKFKYSATGTDCVGTESLGYTYCNSGGEVLQHKIGTVGFLEKEYIGNWRDKKKIVFEPPARVEYEYQPCFGFSYVPAPTDLFPLLEIVKFQKQNVAEERQSRLNNVYKYMLSNVPEWDPDTVATIYSTPVPNTPEDEEEVLVHTSYPTIEAYARSDVYYWDYVHGTGEEV
jgi:hypothetical protein